MPRTTAQHTVWEDLTFFLTDLHCTTSKLQEILFSFLAGKEESSIRSGTKEQTSVSIPKF